METKKAFLLGLVLSMALSLQAQIESRITYRRYTTQDGLPQMQTERLFQDSRGYIYIGTLSGFVRFDGRTFTPFLKGRRENIVEFVENDGQVRALGFRRQWLAGYDDVEMLPIDPKGHWQLNNLNANGLPDGYVLLEDEQEKNRILCRVTAQGFVPQLTGWLLDEMTPDRKLYVDSLGTLIPTASGLYLVGKGDGRRVVRLTSKGDVYTLLRTDPALLAFAADGIYKVGRKGLRAVLPLGRHQTHSPQGSDWSSAAFGLTVRPLRTGGLLIADEHTVYLFDGVRLRQIATGMNLIRDILVDCWNRLWVATYQGVYCFFQCGFTSHRLTDENDIARAIAVDDADRVVMGTLNGKVLQWQGEAALISDGAPYYGTSAVALGGKVFMLTHGDVACVENGSVRTLGLPQDRYKFLGKTDGRLLIVAQKHIVTYDPQTARVDTLSSEIPYPWCAAVDNTGCLWAGSTLGVYSMNRKHQVTKEDSTQRHIVTTMETDGQGTVFFASADSLFMIRQHRIVEMNGQLPQLAGHEVRTLHISPRGYLIVAAVDGLLVCRISKDYQLSDIRFFDHLGGFTLLEPLRATMAEASDGTVWLAGIEETISFRPEELLAYNEDDTYIAPPLRWWQHWWVWLVALTLFAASVWLLTRYVEKRRNRKKLIRLQREKLDKEHQIEAIRQKAIEAAQTALAQDIVKMTERTANERVTFRTASGTIIVEMGDIAYFKGDGNYSQIVTFQGHDTVLMGLGALEKMLSADIFVRADRSTLVNIHNICQLLPKQRRCVFRSAKGQEVETRLLSPAFQRLRDLL